MTDTQNPPFGSEAATAADDAVNRAAQGAHAIVDRVAEKAGPAVERLRSGVNNAAESLQSGTQQLTDLQERWLEDCRSCVRDYPLLSIGVAVAAGMIVSRLIER
jgi:ElaB/YqjD/DUF883 family membrane-anchored ribosome-binding protein